MASSAWPFPPGVTYAPSSTEQTLGRIAAALERIAEVLEREPQRAFGPPAKQHPLRARIRPVDLARHAGVSKQHVNNALTGRCTPGDRLTNAAKELGLPPDIFPKKRVRRRRNQYGSDAYEEIPAAVSEEWPVTDHSKVE